MMDYLITHFVLFVVFFLGFVISLFASGDWKVDALFLVGAIVAVRNTISVYKDYMKNGAPYMRDEEEEEK